MRLFIAADLTPEIREALASTLDQLKARLTRLPVRWILPDHWHLTLRFLGETPVVGLDEMARRLDAACRLLPAFDVRLTRLGCFPDFVRPRVLWVGLEENHHLVQLHEAVQTATAPWGDPRPEPARAGTQDRKPFVPHLTLGRINELPPGPLKRVGRQLEQSDLTTSGPWQIDHVSVMESQLGPRGPQYVLHRSIPLGG